MHGAEAFMGVTPFLKDALPVNIGATVWHDGVTMQHPSVQLVGIPGCATRPFGYCGNDFGAAADLDAATLDAIEESVLALGRWLRQYNYLGTFGVDFLVHRGVPLFTEINPRFQGSTHASSQLSSEADESCLFLDHLAAVLGAGMPRPRRLREVARDLPLLAHLVVHWVDDDARLNGAPLADAFQRLPWACRNDVAAKPSVITARGGVVVRHTARARMTATGFDLASPWAGVVSAWLSDTMSRGPRSAERMEEAYAAR